MSVDERVKWYRVRCCCPLKRRGEICKYVVLARCNRRARAWSQERMPLVLLSTVLLIARDREQQVRSEVSNLLSRPRSFGLQPFCAGWRQLVQHLRVVSANNRAIALVSHIRPAAPSALGKLELDHTRLELRLESPGNASRDSMHTRTVPQSLLQIWTRTRQHDEHQGAHCSRRAEN